MRDPARIERMIALLRKAWYLQPDQRLGQLIENAHREAWQDKAKCEAFHTEDNLMEAGLRSLTIRWKD